MDNSVYIVDGNSLFYRSYYAMEKFGLKTEKGFPTGALFGFANYILKILSEYQPEYFVITFDSGGTTFRHQIFPDYKKDRTEKPEDLKTQFPVAKTIVEYLNIPYFAIEGYEADDIISWLTKRSLEENKKVVVITSDKDLMQLVDENVRLLRPDNGGGFSWFGPEEVEAKMGVPPSKIRGLLAMMGDSSDSIPGVPGIGVKKAQEILGKIDDVEKLMDDVTLLEDIKLRKKLESGMKEFKMCYELVGLLDNVNLPLETVEFLKIRTINKEACVELFKELEFNSILEDPIFR